MGAKSPTKQQVKADLKQEDFIFATTNYTTRPFKPVSNDQMIAQTVSFATVDALANEYTVWKLEFINDF